MEATQTENNYVIGREWNVVHKRKCYITTPLTHKPTPYLYFPPSITDI